LDRPIPKEVHTEDHLVGRARPVLIRRLSGSEFLRCCARFCEPDLSAFLSSDDRSLTLLRPQALKRVHFDTSGKGGLTATVGFRHGSRPYVYKVTDLAWRALGRRLVSQEGATELRWPPATLLQRERLRIRYLAIGRGQKFEGKFWPFVITVVTEPWNQEPIDYAHT